MPKKTTIPKSADIQVTLFDEHYTSDGSPDDVCWFCLSKYQDCQVFEVSWHVRKKPIRVSSFACPKCAKEIAAKYNPEALVEWFQESPARTREVVVAELDEAHQKRQKELNNLYIEQSRTSDKYDTIIRALNEELRKIDDASQPEIAPCKICGSSIVEIQKIPEAALLYREAKFFCQCENGHTGTRAMFGTRKHAWEHWNEIMGGDNV